MLDNVTLGMLRVADDLEEFLSKLCYCSRVIFETSIVDKVAPKAEYIE